MHRLLSYFRRYYYYYVAAVIKIFYLELIKRRRDGTGGAGETDRLQRGGETDSFDDVF